MNWYRQNITKKVLSWVMISIISMLILNKTLNTHAHILTSGEVVYHAHPFSKPNSNGSGANHQHTACEYQILNNAELLFLAIVFTLIIVLTPSWKRHLSISIDFIEDLAFVIKNGRAPPVLLFN